MWEIILSFFAVIGITLLTVSFFDFLFYRRFAPPIYTVLDLREYDEEGIIRVLELLSTVRQKRSGRSATGEIVVLIHDERSSKEEIVYHYMKIFNLRGTVWKDGDERWTWHILQKTDEFF